MNSQQAEVSELAKVIPAIKVRSGEKSRDKRSNLRRYANIVRELAIADFRLKYHDSALGYIWSMLNPLLMFGVYYFVFTTIFHSDIQDYPLFLLIGIMSYTFFQDCTFSAMRGLATKSGIIKKLYFPRSIVVFSSSLTCSLSYFINLTMLFIILLLTKGFSPFMLLSVFPVACLILFSTGIGFLLATLYASYRDISQIWNVLVLAIFWLSSVVFSVEKLPEPISTIVYFNPLTRIFVQLRHFLLYDYFDLRFFILTIVYSLISFSVGYYIFRRRQGRLAELL